MTKNTDTYSAQRLTLSQYGQTVASVVTAVPPRGWINAVRTALGMSGEQLGKRMGISAPSVSSLEKNERAGTARLSTLSRAAEAMDCTLVYAIIPNTTLDDTVERRASQVLDLILSRTAATMALEAQGSEISAEQRERLLTELVEQGNLWRHWESKR